MLKFTVSKTYEIVTPESAEHGDAEDRGFTYEDESMEFSEVIRELKECSHLSDTHVHARTWASTEPEQNYRTGEDTTYSIHISKINGHEPTPHQLRRLFKAAGLIKVRDYNTSEQRAFLARCMRKKAV